MIAYDIGTPEEFFKRYPFYTERSSLPLTQIRVVGDDPKAEALEERAQPLSDHTQPYQSYGFAVNA